MKTSDQFPFPTLSGSVTLLRQIKGYADIPKFCQVQIIGCNSRSLFLDLLDTPVSIAVHREANFSTSLNQQTFLSLFAYTQTDQDGSSSWVTVVNNCPGSARIRGNKILATLNQEGYDELTVEGILISVQVGGDTADRGGMSAYHVTLHHPMVEHVNKKRRQIASVLGKVRGATMALQSEKDAIDDWMRLAIKKGKELDDDSAAVDNGAGNA